MLTCFVGKMGSMLPTIEVEEGGLTLKYKFNLETREMTIEPWEVERPLRHDAVARNYFDSLVGTPEKLMDFAWEGKLSKLDLAELLLPEKRQIYLDTCARFEKAVTEACTAKNDPCLEDGCALESEICLNAVLNAGEVYTAAYVSMWTYFFVEPNNRIPAWKN